MNQDSIKDILNQVKAGNMNVESAMDALRNFDYENLGYAKVDHHRCLRTGFPEVVYAPGKTTDQVVEIFSRLCDQNEKVLITRAGEEKYRAIQERVPSATYNELARTITYNANEKKEKTGRILISAAGTSDIPVAEEAYETAELMGNRVDKMYDVGVAGIHRLLDNQDLLYEAKVIIVVAGMEGALASVVGGLVSAPIIACPTSVGYGASFGGISALLTMLNSCAAGVSVVNIDNGFGAAYSASLINQLNT